MSLFENHSVRGLINQERILNGLGLLLHSDLAKGSALDEVIVDCEYRGLTDLGKALAAVRVENECARMWSEPLSKSKEFLSFVGPVIFVAEETGDTQGVVLLTVSRIIGQIVGRAITNSPVNENHLKTAIDLYMAALIQDSKQSEVKTFEMMAQCASEPNRAGFRSIYESLASGSSLDVAVQNAGGDIQMPSGATGQLSDEEFVTFLREGAATGRMDMQLKLLANSVMSKVIGPINLFPGTLSSAVPNTEHPTN